MDIQCLNNVKKLCVKLKERKKELFIIIISLNGFILGISSAILWSLVDSMEFLGG